MGASVVVPTYNERDRLEELIERIFDAWQSSREPELTGGLEVVVVDDNSPDGTGDCADAIARRQSVRVVHRAGKLGLGTAVIAGFEVARGRVVAVMDADLSHPPQLLPRLIGVLRETQADFVVASRYVRGGSNNDVPVRRFMSRAACRYAGQLTPVQDAMSGFFALYRGSRAIRRDRGQGLQDLPRAAGAHHATHGRRSAVQLRRPVDGQEQDEPRRGAAVREAGPEPAQIHRAPRRGVAGTSRRRR